jgi:hypothetical protein
VSTTPLYTINSSDFVGGKSSGIITVNPTTITNIATLNLKALFDNAVEGLESFTVVLTYGGQKVAESEPISITEDIKYRVIPASTILTEGSTAIKFNVTTPKVPDGTEVPWVINSTSIIAADLLVLDNSSKTAESRLSGFIRTKGNSGTITISARQDAIKNSSDNTEETETFTLSIFPDDETKKDTTTDITINDVSPYIIVPNVTSIKESDAISLATTTKVTFDIYTPYTLSSTIYYTVESSIGSVNQRNNNATATTPAIINNVSIIWL